MGGEGAGNKERGGLSLAQRKKARAKIGEGGSEKAEPSSPTRRKLAKMLLVKPAPGSRLSGWLKAFLFWIVTSVWPWSPSPGRIYLEYRLGIGARWSFVIRARPINSVPKQQCKRG